MDCDDRKEAVICGIDPGLAVTGYAIVKARPAAPSLVDAGVCRFDPALSLAQRLVHLHADVAAILSEHQPVVVAVESLYSHYNHPRTAILMGHARGVILHAAGALGIEVQDFAATRVKRYITGNGRASKGQMQRAIQTALGLPDLPEPPDVADALAIALCCAAAVNERPRAGVVA